VNAEEIGRMKRPELFHELLQHLVGDAMALLIAKDKT
jgi:hypothetical protein